MNSWDEFVKMRQLLVWLREGKGEKGCVPVTGKETFSHVEGSKRPSQRGKSFSGKGGLQALKGIGGNIGVRGAIEKTTGLGGSKNS